MNIRFGGELEENRGGKRPSGSQIYIHVRHVKFDSVQQNMSNRTSNGAIASGTTENEARNSKTAARGARGLLERSRSNVRSGEVKARMLTLVSSEN